MSRTTRGALIGAVGSVALHGAILAVILAYGTMPELGIEFELPAEVEFGLTEGMTVESGAAGAVAAETPSEHESEPTEPLDDEGTEARVDAGRQRRDAGVPRDSGVPRDGGPDAGMLVASAEGEGGVDGGGVGLGGEGEGETTLPPGAQLALRIDMERIRRSPLAADVRQLLGEIPDWQIVLSGSGLEPVDDLDRVMIASPNLERSRMLLAGKNQGGNERVREIVRRMASARGTEAPWRTQHGVPVASWPDEDETERVVAIVGPSHFTITRPEDLPRLLAVARARADEEAEAEEEERERPHWSESLLSMPDGAALTLEVEGARRFMRGARGVPARGRVVVNELPGSSAEIVLTGEYDDEAEAREAQEFWEAARRTYAADLGVRVLGLSSVLSVMEITIDGTRLRARTTVTRSQLRLGLDFLRGQLRAQARERERRLRAREPSPPASSPSPPPSPAP
jgi:hypothetical protein